jgi:hypothetical protein
MPEKFKIFLFVLATLLKLNLLGQTPSDTTKTDSTSAVSNYLFESGFGSNSVFLGRTPANNLPYLMGSVGFLHKSGFFCSLSSFGIKDSSALQNFSNISAGYNFSLSDRIDGSLSYTRFFVDPSGLILQTNTTNLADLFVALDWSYLYTSAGLMSTFGAVNDLFFVFSNSRYFELKSKYLKKGSLGLEPCLMILSGTQNFAATYTENYQQTIINPQNQGPSIPIGGGKPGGGKPGGQGSTTLSDNTDFNLLAVDFSIPLTYSINNISFEGNWKYIIPLNLLEGDPSRAQSIWYFSVYYNLKMKKSK